MAPTATATSRPRRASTTKKSSAKHSTKSSKAQLIQADDLLQLQFVADPQISPAGSSIVFTRKHIKTEKNEYITNLWLVNSDGGEPRQYTSGEKDSQPRWSPDGSRLAFVSSREKHKPQIYIMSAEGGEATALTKFPEGSLSKFKWSRDGTKIAAMFREQDPQWTQDAEKTRKEKGLSDPPRVLNDWWYRLDGDGYFNAQRYHLYIIDVADGSHRKIYDKDAMGDFSFDWSPDGNQIALTTNRDKRAMVKPEKCELLILNVETGKVTTLPGIPDGGKTAVAWSPDGKYIAWGGVKGREGIYTTQNVELFVCDAVKGNARSLTADTDYCLCSAAISDAGEPDFMPVLRWAPDSKSIFLRVGWHGEVHITSVPVKGGPVRMLTDGKFVHELGNVSDNGKRVALLRTDAEHLSEVFFGELKNDSIATKQRTHFNDELLKQRHVAKVTEHWITSKDGNKVQLWVMLPPDTKGYGKKKFPGVLEVHGGPHTQYGVGYFHEFQVLAAAGYAVVYSNPRGSKGYGRDHTHAIHGSWGGADWVDIQAVTEFMQKHPSIDAKRLAIMGGSYGGYITNWAIGHTDIFAAAITDRCVSNLHSMAGSSDYADAPDHYFPGNAWDRPEKLWEMSPLKYFGNVKTPTLIIHSEGDLRCNVEQAEQVHTALMLREVPTKFVRYPRSTFHGMSRNGPPDLRMHRLEQILEWYAKYLK